MKQAKILSAAKAVARIEDGDTVAIQGSGGGVCEPTLILRALGERFAGQGTPRGLTLLHATGLGDQDTIGTDYLAQKGLVKRDIAGHLGMAPKMARMIYENEIEGYNLPQGVISHLYGAIAGRKPGVITKVGLHTFVDPRLEGGKVNAAAQDDLVQVVELLGEEWLFYPRVPIDVAIVRGTTADTKGNVVTDQEPAILEGISIAQAARACGGIVIAQVKHLAEAGTLDPRNVKIPGIYVDYIVVDETQKQTVLGEHNRSFSGEVKIPLDRLAAAEPGPKKVIGLRAARELFAGAVVNRGFGVPSFVAQIAAEQGLLGDITFTVEQGIVGGMPAGGIIFGVAYNPEAIIGEDYQFTFYDGGGLDLAFLGMAQIDAQGNVNVSKVGSMLSGCGGFINITQSARKVVFCGTFTTKGFRCHLEDGGLTIDQDGKIAKLVEKVDQVTFSGRYARSLGQSVLYVTERAVFELTPEGVMLTEIAPGVDLEHDVLGRMAFKPLVAPELKVMDAACFTL